MTTLESSVLRTFFNFYPPLLLFSLSESPFISHHLSSTAATSSYCSYCSYCTWVDCPSVPTSLDRTSVFFFLNTFDIIRKSKVASLSIIGVGKQHQHINDVNDDAMQVPYERRWIGFALSTVILPTACNLPRIYLDMTFTNPTHCKFHADQQLSALLNSIQDGGVRKF